MKIVQLINIGGALTSITVLLHSAPVFLPAVGLALSPFSTLPVALAALINVFLGITVLFASVFVLIAVSPQEAIILLFTTGLLGIVIGSLLYRLGISAAILVSAIALTAGMLILTYIAAIPAFVEFTGSASFTLILLIYIVFSLIYSGIWAICFKKVAERFKKIGLF